MQANPIPAEFRDRLSKADGHINAAERRIFRETERGFWSAHQAVARTAEIWLRLEGLIDTLPEVERYLPFEIMQARIAVMAGKVGAGELGQAWTELNAAEAAIRATPFSSPPNETREELTASIARERRYFDALRNLVRIVEERIAKLHVPLTPGDWVQGPNRLVGRLISLEGLNAQILVPAIALENPMQGIACYPLAHAIVERIDCPQPAPIGSPSWYWLVAAEQSWREAKEHVNGERLAYDYLYQVIGDLLDLASKAWWIANDPRSRWVSFSHSYARQHANLLEGQAPEGISAPLIAALKRNGLLHERCIELRGKLPQDGRMEAAAILGLIRESMDALESLFESEIDLAVGEWIKIRGHGIGHIVSREGMILRIELKTGAILETSLFASRIQRIDPSDMGDEDDVNGDEAGEDDWEV